ncbi:hypothetical protein HDU96_000714 [Phlyctochytrium bullatum]|nr:hypothetical protein HDU96_000714 [Phlyctochytrium bullatum]
MKWHGESSGARGSARQRDRGALEAADDHRDTAGRKGFEGQSRGEGRTQFGGSNKPRKETGGFEMASYKTPVGNGEFVLQPAGHTVENGPLGALFQGFSMTSAEVRTHVLKRILDACTQSEISFVQEYVQSRTVEAAGARQEHGQGTTGEERRGRRLEAFTKAALDKARSLSRTRKSAVKDESCSDERMLAVDEAQINDLSHRLALIPSSSLSSWERALAQHRRRQRSRQRPQQPPTLSSMADEILLQIFYHVNNPASLASCAQVCRRWGTLIRDNLLWRSFCLRNGFGPLRPWKVRVATPNSTAGSHSYAIRNGTSIPITSSRAGHGSRSALQGISASSRDSPYMGRRRRDSLRFAAAAAVASGAAAASSGVSSVVHEILRSGRRSRRSSNEPSGAASGPLAFRESSPGRKLRMFQHPSLAPWKAVYKQNYMTDLNWRRGRFGYCC